MLQINLLPWREQTRRANKTLFLALASLLLGISLVVVFFIHLYFNSLIADQQALNEYLQTQINQENAAIAQLTAKQSDKIAYETKLRFIISIYNNNYAAVRFLNELVKSTPATITLNEIIRKSNTFILGGVAKTDSDISRFMQDLDRTAFFGQPVLSQINAGANSAEQKEFEMTVKQEGQ